MFAEIYANLKHKKSSWMFRKKTVGGV